VRCPPKFVVPCFAQVIALGEVWRNAEGDYWLRVDEVWFCENTIHYYILFFYFMIHFFFFFFLPPQETRFLYMKIFVFSNFGIYIISSRALTEKHSSTFIQRCYCVLENFQKEVFHMLLVSWVFSWLLNLIKGFLQFIWILSVKIILLINICCTLSCRCVTLGNWRMRI